ncbi:MAG: hypothetical protein HQK51_12835 [Oligoflexia bacterium]|nr:hypothetical protein [Oligoflexia bacterium]
MSEKTFDVISWLQKESFNSFGVNYSKSLRNFCKYDIAENDNANYSLDSKTEIFANRFNKSKNQLSSFDTSNSSLSNLINPSYSNLNENQNNNLISIFINNLHIDVLKQFRSLTDLNKSLKISIYDEFLSYAHSKNLLCLDLDNYHAFFSHLNSKNSKYRQELDEFILIYCFRVAALYFFKIRFIIILGRVCKINISLKDILNPSSFFSQIFRKGGPTELNSDAIWSNQYTWYRPTNFDYSKFENLFNNFENIPIKILVKIINHELSYEKHLDNSSENNADKSNQKIYQECLKKFYIDFPKWLRQKNTDHDSTKINNFFSSFNKAFNQEALNCKFTGDNIDDISTSFWSSAYEEILSVDNVNNSFDTSKNEAILFADFITDDSFKERFTKICHELLLLTNLIYLSLSKSDNPIHFICSTYKNKNFCDDVWTTSGQMSMFPDYHSNNSNKYDRIILNLIDFPKTNPHFYLLNKISQQEKYLKDDGIILVCCSKKLFVPSQKDKTDQLLRYLKLESYIDFENLNNKGNVPSYVYIFSKNTLYQNEDIHGNNNIINSNNNNNSKNASYNNFTALFNDNNDNKKSSKVSCYSFRFSGHMSSVYMYFKISESIGAFFKSRKIENTPFFHTEISDSITFEFFQDAVIDGRLINSTPKDSPNITHPSFFKNILKTCIPLDNFFQIENVKIENNLVNEFNQNVYSNSSSLFSSNPTIEDRYSYILIANFNNNDQPRIEIISNSLYRSKVEEYGIALCHYFGLIPKLANININLFKEYFDSNLGQQILSLSLGHSTNVLTKLKAKITSILIPKFFLKSNELNFNDKERLKILTFSHSQIMSIHPNEIIKEFNLIKPSLIEFSRNNPWDILNLLSYFNVNIQTCLNSISLNTTNNNIANNNNKEFSINFSNPLIIDLLLKCQTKPIYPNNEEFYIELKISNATDIHTPLNATKLNNLNGNDYSLDLISNNKVILSIYSDLLALNFLNYILRSLIGHNISIAKAITSVRIPHLDSLKAIISNFQNLQTAINSVKDDTINIINLVMREQILIQT